MLEEHSQIYKKMDISKKTNKNFFIYEMTKQLMFGEISKYILNYKEQEIDIFEQALKHPVTNTYMTCMALMLEINPSIFCIGENLTILLENTTLNDMIVSDFHLPTQRERSSGVIIKIKDINDQSMLKINEVFIAKTHRINPSDSLDTLNEHTRINEERYYKIPKNKLKNAIRQGLKEQEEVLKKAIIETNRVWDINFIGEMNGKTIMITCMFESIENETIFDMKKRCMEDVRKTRIGNGLISKELEEVESALNICINCLLYWQNKDSGKQIDISDLKKELDFINTALKTKRIDGKKIKFPKKRKLSKRKFEIEAEIKRSSKIKFFDAEPIKRKPSKDNKNKTGRKMKMRITRGYWRKKPYHDVMEYIKPYISGSLEPDTDVYKSIRDLE